MKAPHLVERFTRAIWPGRPRPSDERWVESILEPGELLLFRRLPNHDQRHAIRVARYAEEHLGDDGEPRWLAAALLHDVGKYDARLSVPGRAVATIVVAADGRRHLDRWSRGRGPVRRFAVYARHGEIGADEIRRAGGREVAAAWSAAHHHPEQWLAIGIPPHVVQVLDAADNA
ncbi:MAG TPA: HD domain-containing protein [Acidimicrobiia bacterium]|jgi:hypothetical protein